MKFDKKRQNRGKCYCKLYFYYKGHLKDIAPQIKFCLHFIINYKAGN